VSEGAFLPPVVARLMGDISHYRTEMGAATRVAESTAGSIQATGTKVAAATAKLGKQVSIVGAGVAVASVKMAGDFEAQTMVLHTAAGESLKGLATVRKGILDIAKGTGTDWHNLTDGMYQVEKAGYRGSDGLKVLRAAAQGAREENASLSSVTNAMTSVMASYHLKATDSVRVMNGMKTAAGEGKMTMEEFASPVDGPAHRLRQQDQFRASYGRLRDPHPARHLCPRGHPGTRRDDPAARRPEQRRDPGNAAPGPVVHRRFHQARQARPDRHPRPAQQYGPVTKMGPSGTVLLSTFNTTKQAAHDANIMLQGMPHSIQGLAKSYADGKDLRGRLAGQLKGTFAPAGQPPPSTRPCRTRPRASLPS
jgi:hypothetical protein